MSATATIRLPESLLKQAKIRGKAEHRKPAEQIAYWVQIAQCALDNPDLSVNEIKETFLARAEAEEGLLSDYKFG
jgi:hypothetical protein